MKKRFFLLFLCLLLVVSISAQEQINVIDVKTEIKGSIDDGELLVYPQVTTGDKPGVQLLTCFTLDVDEELWQMIKLSDSPEIHWIIEYTAVFKSNVSFLYVWSGPEYGTFQTPWYNAKYKKYYYTSVTTDNNWKKGTYTLTVIALHGQNKSGAEAVATCRVRLY